MNTIFVAPPGSCSGGEQEQNINFIPCTTILDLFLFLILSRLLLLLFALAERDFPRGPV